ncbi:hypothetical protein [Paludifilum halophilum]|uniref:hypothetical protein n=1 Tax=Paludifilum halophilum TaxID=1642702 RepID=UPI0011400D5D|nr:hypothetical protein [Paludifilum halophilum]
MTWPKHSNGYNYKTIGKYADRVFIMTYDWHIPPFTGPEAIAPYPRVAKTMKYASSVISPQKLYLGLSM